MVTTTSSPMLSRPSHIALWILVLSVIYSRHALGNPDENHRWRAQVNGLDKKARNLLAPLLDYQFTVPERQLLKGLSYYGSSTRLRKFVADLLAGTRPLRVGAVGGSHSWTSDALTLGLDDWFSLFKAWLASATPVAVSSRNGCIPGTTPGYLAPCLDAHVDPDVDLLLIEYTPNVDTTDRMHDRVAGNVFVKDLEKLLQRLLAWPSRPALVLVNAPHAHLALTPEDDAAGPPPPLGSGHVAHEGADLPGRFYNTMEDVEGALTTLFSIPSVSARPLLHHLRARLRQQQQQQQQINTTTTSLQGSRRRMTLSHEAAAVAQASTDTSAAEDPGSSPAGARTRSKGASGGETLTREHRTDHKRKRTHASASAASTADATAADTGPNLDRRIALEQQQRRGKPPSASASAADALLRMVETAGGDAALVVHRTLADLLVYLIQTTALDLQYTPVTEGERELLARPVPRPMYPEDAPPVSTACLQSSALQSAVSSSPGWSWTNVGLPSAPRYGFASSVPHAKLHIPLTARLAAHPAARLSVALQYLKSAQGGMGMVGLRCSGGGCFCKAHAVDARLDVPAVSSQGSSAWLTVVPRGGLPGGEGECDVVVTVLANTTSGGHNFVITGIGIAVRQQPLERLPAAAAAATNASAPAASAAGAVRGSKRHLAAVQLSADTGLAASGVFGPL